MCTHACTQRTTSVAPPLQVNLLEWLAKEVSGWDYFAPSPRGKPDPAQVLLSISAAHKVIQDYEWLQTAPDGGWLDDPTDTSPEVRTCTSGL